MDEQSADPVSDVAQMREFARRIALRRWWIAGLAFFFAAVAGFWQQVSDRQYKATTVVAIATEDAARAGGLSALVGQLGPLASLAGIQGLGGSQKFEPIAVLESRSLTERYVEANQLLPVLFAKNWDASRRKWNVSDPEKVPTLWKAYEKFRKDIRRVTQDAKTGLVSVSVTWTDPAVAADWANGMVSLTNDSLRRRALQESDRNIAYLTEQARTTGLLEVRNALTALIEQEMKRAMITRGTNEYAFRVIDPAAPPGEPSSPGFALAIAAGLLAGLGLALLAVYVDWIFRGASPGVRR